MLHKDINISKDDNDSPYATFKHYKTVIARKQECYVNYACAYIRGHTIECTFMPYFFG